MISNDAILPPSSSKKNRRSTGLPGKFPTRWLVTTVFPSFSSHAKGSLVYSYFADASVFHSLIAARPLWVCPSSFTTAFGFWQAERFCCWLCLFHIRVLSRWCGSVLSNCWNCPAINHKLAAGDGGSSVRCQKGDEFCDFVRFVRTTQGNTAEHVHQLLPGGRVVAFVFVGHSLDHSGGRIGFNEAG